MPRPILLALTLTAAVIQSAFAQTAPATRTRTADNPKASATTPSATTPASCACPTTPAATQRHYPPYSAKQETTSVQTLADGTVVRRVTETSIWRDALGRMRTDASRPQPDGTESHFLTVNDPVAGVRFSWSDSASSSTSKIVTIVHFPRANTQPQAAPIPQPARRYYPTRTESLPPQTIDGFYVEGSRTTNITPAGYDGNDRDIVSIAESWIAPELGLQLRGVRDDPRSGKITTELTDIKVADPDPSLFQLPAGFKINDTNP